MKVKLRIFYDIVDEAFELGFEDEPIGASIEALCSDARERITKYAENEPMELATIAWQWGKYAAKNNGEGSNYMKTAIKRIIEFKSSDWFD